MKAGEAGKSRDGGAERLNECHNFADRGSKFHIVGSSDACRSGFFRRVFYVEDGRTAVPQVAVLPEVDGVFR